MTIYNFNYFEESPNWSTRFPLGPVHFDFIDVVSGEVIFKDIPGHLFNQHEEKSREYHMKVYGEILQRYWDHIKEANLQFFKKLP